MKVSIVTPAYNAEAFLPTTIQSVMDQDYPKIEHIVIDDGSIDATSDILKRFESKYNLRWISKRNEGQAIAVNTGFEMAEGDIIFWLNSDDVLFTKDIISQIVRIFNNSSVDVVYGHMAIIDEMNTVTKVQLAPKHLDFVKLSIAHFAACVSYRTPVALNYKLDSRLRYALDYDQCLKMASDSIKFGFLDRVIMGWRKHSQTKSLTGSSKMKYEAALVKSHYNPQRKSSSLFSKLLILGNAYLNNLYKLRDVLELKNEVNRSNYAFPIRFEPSIKLACSQLIPYS